jgi:hypothetical protein
MTQRRLKLFDKVLFLDWNGVLSFDLFWASVLGSDRGGALKSAIGNRLTEVFTADGSLSDQWMLGTISTETLFSGLNGFLGRRRKDDFLKRRIIEDCMNMRVDSDLVQAIAKIRMSVPVVVATDNTHDFALAFGRARSVRQGVSAHATSTPRLIDTARNFDGLICSSEVGALKAANPGAFFELWLDINGLDFGDALLVDDRLDNCMAFEAVGGNAIQWSNDSQIRSDVLRQILEWSQVAIDSTDVSIRRGAQL